MKQYRLFMLLASVFLLAGLNSCLHEEFSESTLPEKGLSLSLNVISSSYAPTGVETILPVLLLVTGLAYCR